VIDTHVPSPPTLDAPQSPTANPDVTFTGSGEAGARVSVLDSYSRLLCSAAVAASGAWSCAAPGVADGDYLLTALQATLAGRTSGPSAAISLSVRTLQAPLFDALREAWGAPRPGAMRSPAAVSRTTWGGVICSAVADGGGRWSCRPASALADGSYLFRRRWATPGATPPAEPRGATAVDTVAPLAPLSSSPYRPRQRLCDDQRQRQAGISVSMLDA
jgi:hypothetical protein